MAEQLQAVTSETIEMVCVDQNYTGEQPIQDAAAQRMQLHVVKLPEAKRGIVPLPRSRVVDRIFAWATRIRRLAKDYERLPETLARFIHLIA